MLNLGNSVLDSDSFASSILLSPLMPPYSPIQVLWLQYLRFQNGSDIMCLHRYTAGIPEPAPSWKILMRKDSERICFVFALACVVCKKPKDPKLSSMADDAIIQGGTGGFVSLVYICVCLTVILCTCQYFSFVCMGSVWDSVRGSSGFWWFFRLSLKINMHATPHGAQDLGSPLFICGLHKIFDKASSRVPAYKIFLIVH